MLCLFKDKTQQVESLDFLGTVNDNERRTICSAFPKPIRKKITFHGRFDFVEGDWDPEVEVFDRTPSEHDAPDSSSEDSSSEDSCPGL